MRRISTGIQILSRSSSRVSAASWARLSSRLCEDWATAWENLPQETLSNAAIPSVQIDPCLASLDGWIAGADAHVFPDGHAYLSARSRLSCHRPGLLWSRSHGRRTHRSAPGPDTLPAVAAKINGGS